MAIPAETFFLDPEFDGTLQKQIQSMIAQGILAGRFQPGEKLPSSRALARHLGVSRITVTLAYTELLADDYLSSKGRSGYFVSQTAPRPITTEMPLKPVSGIDWSRWLPPARKPSLEKPEDWQKFPYPFIYGQADPKVFDHRNWRLCALQALGQRDFHAMTADSFSRDDAKLIEYISRHSLPRRGIAARPEEILVTLGAQNALWLTAEILLGRGRVAAMEDPGYPGLRDVLRAQGGPVHAIPVDSGGLVPEAIPSDTDLLFATPSHHAPTAATLAPSRRQALLEKAKTDDFLIVEDDYEFETSFQAPPQPSLKSLDRHGRVIHVGSFSKSLFPGLRLGYLVGPEPFISEARTRRAAMLRHPPGLAQRTLAYFLSLGHYDALIRRLARALAHRREVIDAAIDAESLTRAPGSGSGGSSLWMQAPEGVDTAELAAVLRERGVLIEPGAPFFADANPPRNFYRLAYSSIPAERIPEGIAKIAEAIGQ